MADRPSWSLCIATLNRREALLRTLDYAKRQTCPPAQIVVVDVSDDWQDVAVLAQAILSDAPGIVLDYTTSLIRSSATQRNEGIARCTGDIVFLLDDDSFLFPDCAERILDIYAADHQGAVAGVAAVLVPDLPPAAPDTALGDLPQRKASGRRAGAGVKARVLQTGIGRWFNRKILLQNKDELFLKYDEPRHRAVPAALAGVVDVTAIAFMPGSATTVRRSIALAEPFDPALRYYAAFEDLDAAYRYGRHGVVLRANDAHLHHFEAAGGRLKRQKLVIFQLLNMLIFLKRHAANPDTFVPLYRRLLRRRLLGEALKDLLSGRLTLPQARGVLRVMGLWRDVWARDTAEIEAWYPRIQQDILDRLD
ncbi:glycosyltransferase [Gymnodinialimonas sp. 2305UL16-5]|uniref:glycosyltransferase family 2 protein n=1 Tax=Gymnodinialimonas mytili TaxID=3126503 RepID=UPI0030A3197F